MQNSSLLNTEFIITFFNTEFITFNTEFITLNTEFITLNTKFIILNTEFIFSNPKFIVSFLCVQQGLAHIQDFVDDTKRMNIPVDFVSTHSYPSDEYCSQTADPDCFTKKLLETRTIAQKGGLPFLITEYKGDK